MFLNIGAPCYIESDESFLFSLANRDDLAPFKMPVNRNQAKAICTNQNFGPTFGGGYDIYYK